MPCTFTTRVITAVHILIYEWQTSFFYQLHTSSVSKLAFGSRFWGLAFPVHLDRTGSSKAVKRRYLPEPDWRPRAPYEAHAEWNSLDRRTARASTSVRALKKDLVSNGIGATRRLDLSPTHPGPPLPQLGLGTAGYGRHDCIWQNHALGYEQLDYLTCLIKRGFWIRRSLGLGEDEGEEDVGNLPRRVYVPLDDAPGYGARADFPRVRPSGSVDQKRGPITLFFGSRFRL
ncbi:hypothetical protein BDK51DRAFT_49008 [Blyttiomyces helicus]|uniref:Uncharacterized protein n=1 Tax=Blyttiomyces helicus TaxID=388810 RepID=A0A4P9W1Z2_9FUNG|nr:hypothetical protein BDK51DRAFT_49008 [Blyttiomyces helicus]|eukprot:RKO86134.1 hypothetical protein BDK51DRAFT_49008 [Blyttiomyces helicus]